MSDHVDEVDIETVDDLATVVRHEGSCDRGVAWCWRYNYAAVSKQLYPAELFETIADVASSEINFHGKEAWSIRLRKSRKVLDT